MSVTDSIVIPERRIPTHTDKDVRAKNINALIDELASARSGVPMSRNTKLAIGKMLQDESTSNHAAFLTRSPKTKTRGTWMQMATKAVRHLELADISVAHDVLVTNDYWEDTPCPILGKTWKTWLRMNEMAGLAYALDEEFDLVAKTKLDATRRRKQAECIKRGIEALSKAILAEEAKEEVTDDFLASLV